MSSLLLARTYLAKRRSVNGSSEEHQASLSASNREDLVLYFAKFINSVTDFSGTFILHCLKPPYDSDSLETELVKEMHL